MNNPIRRVAIAGGTHGNELVGVHLVKHWKSAPKEIQRASFSTELHLTNPAANKALRRYIDQDLNRQFYVEDLNNTGLMGCEQQRAKVLNELLGPKEDPRIDFVIDMHTTTANMGTSLIFNLNDPFVVGMAFYIKQKMPNATLFFNPRTRLEDNFLMSVGRLSGLLIEVGPIAQGLLNYEVYSQTQSAVYHGLDYIEARNTGQYLDLPSQLSGYKFTEKVPLPVDEDGEITAMIHPNLQDKDYCEIAPGDPLFITLAGKTIYYQGESSVYGAFINEAAYYDQNIGLSFMEKIDIVLNDK